MRVATITSVALNLVLGAVFLLLPSHQSASPSLSLAPATMRTTTVPHACARMSNAPAMTNRYIPNTMSRQSRISQPSFGSLRPLTVNAGEGFMPPPVASTTTSFHSKFKYPLPMLFASFVSRLLTEQHFVRYNRKYTYNPVFALGVCSVFDQVFESLGEERKGQLFDAFISALDESPDAYRKDQATLEEWAKSRSASDIAPNASGDDIEKLLAGIADGADTFHYSKFFSIGLFRMLELTGAKDPKALENLVSSLNLRMDPVIRDLNYYKGSLSALIQAQELKKEAEARAQKKREEAASKKTEAIKNLANKRM
eukprot:CAMPEP_0114505588 /NCGR_PEP_ID=MMETSP0109-20121206/10938_1 /TAXON_ID=29199 /ORGANISM="Chlorarachnion reptans, Strain CCCM449" /LENGTH=311 /DNA_ID=CAMNT_0001684047 /DNA_START=156 /DNA_END=1091 /DNA_ORIENTATION=-